MSKNRGESAAGFGPGNRSPFQELVQSGAIYRKLAQVRGPLPIEDREKGREGGLLVVDE
jgi:hypothetical protein